MPESPSPASEEWAEATAARSRVEQRPELATELHGEGGQERSMLPIVSRG